ncbi:MAG: ACP S-malonyltransferase [Candidatus Aminicenantes bacterium]|nr:ACP S-malonyltransferase [Candidatus Aminicenantes bacterium]
MRAYLFPGLKSRQKGMSGTLFDRYSHLTAKADEVLGYSIKELCLEDPGGKLAQTRYHQAALYVVNALCYLAKAHTDPKPDYVLGQSAAEYDALFASGVVDFETGLMLVKKRGELMAQAKGGAMAAVNGLTENKIKEILKQNNIGSIYIADYHSTFQVVISGPREDILRAEPICLNNGAKYYRVLKANGAFHTPYMEEIKKEFRNYVRQFKFSDIEIPIISNVTARPYQQDQVKENMIEQMTRPVRWRESIRYLLAEGGTASDFDEIDDGGLSMVKALAIRIENETGPFALSQEEA